MDEQLEDWHAGIVPKVNIACSEGWCNQDSFQKFVAKLSRLDAAAFAGGVKSVAASKAAANRMRDAVKGSFKLVTFAQMDPQFHEDAFFLTFATREWRIFMGRQQKELGTSLQDTKKFHFDILDRKGLFWESFSNSLHPISRRGNELLKIGVITEFDFGTAAIYDPYHPQRIEQRRLSKAMWWQNLHQASSFLRGFGHYYDGYP